MGLMRALFKPFTVIDGVEYYSVSTVSKIVGRSVQTIRLWDNYSEELEKRKEPRLIPKPIRVGKKNSRCWTEDQIAEIVEFANNLEYGDIAEFSRQRWGKRAESLTKDLSTNARQARKEYRKKVNKKGKISQERKKVAEIKKLKKDMLKAVRHRAKKMYEGMDLDEKP